MLFSRDHKATPISPLIFLQTGNQSLILKKIISQQPQEVNLLFLYHCTDRYLSKNIYKKVTQFDLYFLSKPEVKV